MTLQTLLNYGPNSFRCRSQRRDPGITESVAKKSIDFACIICCVCILFDLLCNYFDLLCNHIRKSVEESSESFGELSFFRESFTKEMKESNSSLRESLQNLTRTVAEFYHFFVKEIQGIKDVPSSRSSI